MHICADHIHFHQNSWISIIACHNIPLTVSNLEQGNPKIYCANVIIRLFGMYWFQFDSIDEFQVSEKHREGL